MFDACCKYVILQLLIYTLVIISKRKINIVPWMETQYLTKDDHFNKLLCQFETYSTSDAG